jgi:peptidoglycan/LPS O-acetylase OafA/YrhL
MIVRLGIGICHGAWSLGEWDLLIRKLAISRIDAIAYGALAAVLADKFDHSFARWALVPAAMFVGWSIWICFHVQKIPGVVGWLLLFPIAGIGLSLLMPYLAAWRSRHILATPVQFLARISYALYLVHWAFMFIALTVPETYRLVVYVGGSVTVATVLSYAIEHPIMAKRPKQI